MTHSSLWLRFLIKRPKSAFAGCLVPIIDELIPVKKKKTWSPQLNPLFGPLFDSLSRGLILKCVFVSRVSKDDSLLLLAVQCSRDNSAQP